MMTKPTDMILDQKVLDALFASVGEETAPVLMASLRAEIATFQQFIHECAENVDWRMIDIKSHAMKSVAASFGALRLSAICLAVEENARGAQDEVLLKAQCDILTYVVEDIHQAFGWQ